MELNYLDISFELFKDFMGPLCIGYFFAGVSIGCGLGVLADHFLDFIEKLKDKLKERKKGDSDD